MPEDIKSEVRDALAEVKKALESNDTDAIKSASERAAQVSQKMGTAIYQQAQAPQAQALHAANQAARDGIGYRLRSAFRAPWTCLHLLRP